MNECGAKNRQGKPCKHPGGWGTDHPGEGRCKLHGGATPIKTGRYSKIKTRRLGERIAEFEADPDPLDLLPEVAGLRAIVAGFMERFDELEDALLAWNADEVRQAQEEQRKPRPVRVPAIEDAASLLEAVSRVVEKVHKMRTSQAVTLEQVTAWFHAFGQVVARHVDADTAARIERDWAAILPRA